MPSACCGERWANRWNDLSCRYELPRVLKSAHAIGGCDFLVSYSYLFGPGTIARTAQAAEANGQPTAAGRD